MVSAGLPAVPGFLVRSVGRRYVAGEDLEDALDAVHALSEEGSLSTVDVLGEDVDDPGQADEAVREYLRLVDALAGSRSDATISIKPTLMGLMIGESIAERNMDRVFAAAADRGLVVQIDMEDHTATDTTLWLYRTMQERYGNAGAVLQARLRRTLDDAASLASPGAEVRLCKGIYLEPEDIAHQGFEEIQESYIAALRRLFEGGARVGIATHDTRLVEEAEALVRERGLTAERYEFQMLLGVRPGLRRRLIEAGHAVRVYVPYGRDWEAYSIRRLRENPEMAGHALKGLFTRS
jgi:proline dehydrogenase